MRTFFLRQICLSWLAFLYNHIDIAKEILQRLVFWMIYTFLFVKVGQVGEKALQFPRIGCGFHIFSKILIVMNIINHNGKYWTDDVIFLTKHLFLCLQLEHDDVHYPAVNHLSLILWGRMHRSQLITVFEGGNFLTLKILNH